MARIVGPLPVEELEARYRAARDATEARHFQAIWLLARGRTFLEAAEVLAFAPRWVEELAARYNAFGPDALGDRRPEPLLNAARRSGVAARGFRGRGAWIDHSIRFRASQPRCGCTLAKPRRRAIQAATLGPVHSPPSSGGLLTRLARAASSAGVRRLAVRPFRRRRSPSASGPNAL